MRRKASFILKFLLLSFSLLLQLTACNSKLYIHDRHLFSYEPVKKYCQSHKNTTLVLFDYHNDIHPSFKILNSITWVGSLFEEGLITDLIWVSGRTMEKPNRESRRWWLERNTKGIMPELEEYILNHTQILDYHDLCKIKMKGNFVITVDFDIMMKDPGPDPENFSKELAQWISKQNPKLLTLALSSAYHKNNQAWSYFDTFIENYNRKAAWYINCDDFGTAPESNDEKSAWKLWNLKKSFYMQNELSYYPGSYLWVKAPVKIKEKLLQKNIKGETPVSEIIINGWKEELSLLTSAPSCQELEEYFDTVHSSLKGLFSGTEPDISEGDIYASSEKGLAVRFMNQGLDRGCLSLYSNVGDFKSAVKFCTLEAAKDPRYLNITREESSNLDINISIFTGWKEMSSPLDFIPGLHSLILQTPDGEKTLLQPSVSLERNYTQEQFLQTLCRKAGLDKNAWKNPELSFMKSTTFTYYQWNEKPE